MKLTMMVRETELECRTCATHFPLSKEKQTQRQVRRGCFGDAKEPFTIDNEKIMLCPVKQVSSEAMEWMDLYMHYKNGYLPIQGGILQQPKKYLDAIGYIGYLDYKLQKDRNDSEKRKHKQAVGKL